MASFFFFKRDTFSFSSACLAEPVINDDYALHFSESLYSAHFFRTTGKIWGYSPYHYAGYPAGIFQAIDNHWALMFQIFLGWLFNPAFVFNLSIFAGYLAIPLLAFFTARNFRMDRINSFFFFVISIFFVIGFKLIKDFMRYGMYGFIIAVFFSFFTSSFFFRYLRTRRFQDLAKLALFGALTFFIHPLSAFICAILCAPILLMHIKKLRLKDFLMILACCGLILLMNLFWILPFISFIDLYSGFGHYFQTSLVFMLEFFKTPAHIIISLLFLWLIPQFGIDKKLKISMLSSLGVLFILSFFGSQLGFSWIEPARFAVPLFFIVILMISSAFKAGLENPKIIFFLGIFLLFLLLIKMPLNFHCGYSQPEAGAILNFIQDNTTKNSRIHVQDGEYEPYFRSHFTALIPHLTSREILAGAHNIPPITSKFSQFMDDKIFSQSFENISDKKFKDYLQAYNIKYLLIHNNRANNFLSNKTGFKKIFDYGRYKIFEYTESEESFCYNCNAIVEADYNRIEVLNATSGVTILKYHYIKTLKIEPSSLKIKPVKLLDDPVPFIMVENGNVTNFVVYN